MFVGEGFLLTLVAGIMMGGNLLPMKWMKAWRWENFWLVYSIMALVVVPFALAFILLPGIGGVYASLSPRVMLLPFLYGLTWGIAQLGAGSYAARLCYDLVLGGYSDWYLPSKDELNQLWVNRAAIGGFANNSYWSSTEYDDYDAWFQSFVNGGQSYYSKDSPFHVRAIRAF